MCGEVVVLARTHSKVNPSCASALSVPPVLTNPPIRGILRK